ncbi:hypothetical protein CHF27_011205 [Romboutsia maritimum]|uniref:Phage head-tail adapter protein n=1 Tax=Romboutsia maritimum TaxID=2020948 RepID=A0A371IQW6_9FIRM|nr:hypothetical protein [Romboutsia maritimum]RDY22879.1 hypothetical protein CHF27_011205 [Romboutsia maritimum]
MIANKIKPKIVKAINKLPTKAIIKRNSVNEFGEPEGEVVICEVTGLFHEGNNQVTSISMDKGEVKRNKQQFLMVVYDDETMKIKENDIAYIDNDKFEIKDLGNQNRMNVYLDLNLKLVK